MFVEKFATLVILLVLLNGPCYCWWSWNDVVSSKAEFLKYDPHLEQPLNSQNMRKFEIHSIEEKFLLSVENFLKVSPLEACKYKAIIKLKASCSDMSDEDISRFAIGLINCQRETENLSLFKCDSTIPLSECVQAMNDSHWSVYQTVLDSAKLTCIVLNQNIYRNQMENTVNKISDASQSYLISLGKFKIDNEHLLEQTNEVKTLTKQISENIEKSSKFLKVDYENLKNLVSQNSNLLKTQNKFLDDTNELSEVNFAKLKQNFEMLQNQINTFEKNFEDRQKRSIEEFNNKFQNAQRELMKSHEELMNKMDQHVAKLLLNIEKNSESILRNQERANVKYEESLAHLDMLNSSVHYLNTAIHVFVLKIDNLYIRARDFWNLYGDFFICCTKLSVFLLVALVVSYRNSQMRQWLLIQLFSFIVFFALNYACWFMSLAYMTISNLLSYALVSQIALFVIMQFFKGSSTTKPSEKTKPESISESQNMKKLDEPTTRSNIQIDYNAYRSDTNFANYRGNYTRGNYYQ